METIKNQIFAIFLFLTSVFTYSQSVEEKLIHCKIESENTTTEGINVLNLLNERTTASNENGEFYILAKSQDLLLLTAVNFEIKRKLIEEEDLKKEVIIIKMIPKNIELKEVKVNQYSEINAVNLGIVSKDIKRYSAAERKLYTAQTGILDPLLNWMSGRTTMLEKELIVEKKEKLLLKLEGVFEDEYYINELKVPQEYIKGFQYYIIDDSEFAAALLAKNKTLMKYLLKRLAVEYNQMITYEK